MKISEERKKKMLGKKFEIYLPVELLNISNWFEWYDIDSQKLAIFLFSDNMNFDQQISNSIFYSITYELISCHLFYSVLTLISFNIKCVLLHLISISDPNDNVSINGQE